MCLFHACGQGRGRLQFAVRFILALSLIMNHLAFGYDSARFALPSPEAAKDACAARLSLYGRYLFVEDNGGCGGMNVSFAGVYVRAGGR